MMTGNRGLWIGSARTLVLAVVFGAALALLAVPAFAQQAATQQAAMPKRDDYEQVLERYLQAARAVPTTPDNNWAAGLFADLRARRVNDLVTVRVVENITASGSADSALDKKSSGSASVTKLFGLDTKFPGWLDPTSLAAMSANTGFTGSGATSRAGSLSAVITARIVEVLPNSDLVLEGIREVDINGDRQFIVLSGIVRAADIGPGNVVPSTAVGQMQIRYFGKGLIKDNLKPGWLVKVLNKVF
jgi:flagellar L-ring protein precursor FlgH